MKSFLYVVLLAPQLPEVLVQFLAPNLFLKDGHKYLLTNDFQYGHPFVSLKAIFFDDHKNTDRTVWLPAQLVLAVVETKETEKMVGFVPYSN